MKLIISLSNRNGCSEQIANILNENLENSKKIILRNYNVKNCIGCLYCDSSPTCAIKDDMLQIYEQLKQADHIIFILPNYFGNLSGFAKNFFDRLHPFYRHPGIANKKATFIYIGGGDENLTLHELDEATKNIVKYLKFNKMNSYSIKALNKQDLTNNLTKIENILNSIKSI